LAEAPGLLEPAGGLGHEPVVLHIVETPDPLVELLVPLGGPGYLAERLELPALREVRLVLGALKEPGLAPGQPRSLEEAAGHAWLPSSSPHQGHWPVSSIITSCARSTPVSVSTTSSPSGSLQTAIVSVSFLRSR